MTTTKRRYLPIGSNSIYDEEFDNEILTSHIFNSDEIVSTHTVLWDRGNIEKEILRYKGNDKGEFWRLNERNRAFIPAIKDKLTEIDLKFEEFKNQTG